MSRSRLAPLSPNEEITLRRVTAGISEPVRLSQRDLEHLQALLLIEDHDGNLRLTPAGRERYRALPNSTVVDQADKSTASIKPG
jgi:hypothetical protein